MSAVAETSPAAPTVATPAEELTALVTWGAAAFWWAEQGKNPAVKTYWDALNYIATSLSVGYANIFPVTAVGKTIGAVVMMLGPALSARALDATPRMSGDDGGAVAALGPKLDAILEELRRVNARG